MAFKIVNQLLEVPSTDTEDARRRHLLNILLIGMYGISLLMLIAMTIVTVINQNIQSDYIRLGSNIGGFFLGGGVIYLINRYWSGEIASSIFLLLLTIIFAFSDTPQHVVEGRALFLLTIPTRA